MREDNLLSLRRKKHVFTTDSAHTLPVYPNLARHAALTALNQLWVADITFIRLRNEFIYLAVVLDAYSRRVIGWDLGRTLHAKLAIRALQMALRGRVWKAEGMIHHSDRGIQYASSDYTELLEHGEIQISMSRRGNPYDNARAERFMRTLKEEEVYGADYRDLEEARSRIGEFLEQTYNRQRLHSALRYLTPEEFEQASIAKESDGADGSGGKPKAGLPPLPQALEIPPGFPHSRGYATAQSIKRSKNGPKCHQINRVPACLSLGVHSKDAEIRGQRFVVRDSWSEIRGQRFVVRDSWSLRDSWSEIRGQRFVVRDSWSEI